MLAGGVDWKLIWAVCKSSCLVFSQCRGWMPKSMLGVSIPGYLGRSCKAFNAPAFKVTQHRFCHVVWAGASSRAQDYTGLEYQEAWFIGTTLSQRSLELERRLDQRHEFGHWQHLGSNQNPRMDEFCVHLNLCVACVVCLVCIMCGVCVVCAVW